MFILKLFKNPHNGESKISTNKKNIHDGTQKDNFITIIINTPSQSITCNNSHLSSNGIQDEDPQGTVSVVDNINNENNILPRKNHRLVEIPTIENIVQCTGHFYTTKEYIDPFIEYTDEPLLPLIEACVPLMNIIPDLSTYVQQALIETLTKPPDDLTHDESAAIRLYTMEWEQPYRSLYSMLNSNLKNPDRQHLRPYYKYLKLLLTALVKLPCAPMQTVWRGVHKDLSKNFSHSTQVVWWSFSSCTASLPVLENNMYLGNTGERTLLSVEAINGRIIRPHSHFDYEDEILLLPGTYMEVQSQLCPAPGLHIIHLKQIKPKETLLALPFENALLYPQEIKSVPWYKKKRTFIELSVLISLCIAGLILGLVFGIKKSPPPSICYTRSNGIKADLFWSFDCGDAREDLKRINNGTNKNGANYSSPDFSGQGKALDLDPKLNQYIELPQSLNLTMNTSFTVTVWIFSTRNNHVTILSDCNTFTSICIDLFIYNGIFYAKTYNWKDANNSQSVKVDVRSSNCRSCWRHLAFVYNNQTNLLSIYIDGELKIRQTFSPISFVTTKANALLTSYIGASAAFNTLNSFDGLTDQLSISYHVKNASEILDEATLLCSYNFNSNDTNADSGPNHINAYIGNAYQSLSNNDSVLRFNSSDSYVQTSGFTLLTSNKYEFTITFWLRPIFQTYDQVNISIPILQVMSKAQEISSENYACLFSLTILCPESDKRYFHLKNEFNPYHVEHKKKLVQNDTWIHISVKYSYGSLVTLTTLYLDGEEYDSIYDNPLSSLTNNPRLAVTIGGDYADDTITSQSTNYESRKCFLENSEFPVHDFSDAPTDWLNYPQYDYSTLPEIRQFKYTSMYGEIDDLEVFARALYSSEIANLAESKP